MNIVFGISVIFGLMCIGCWCKVLRERETGDGLKKSVTNLLTECMDKSGADIPDLQAISERRLPDTHAGLCMVECALENMNIMKNGKFSAQSALKTMAPILKFKPQKMTQMTQLATLCDKEISRKGSNIDGCETAKLLVKCIDKYGDQYGMDISSPGGKKGK